MQLRARDVDATEFTRVGLPNQHGATEIANACCVGAGVGRDLILERHRSMRVGPAVDLIKFLDTDRYAAERFGNIGRERCGRGLIAREIAKRVQLALVNRCQRRLQLLSR